MARIGRTSALRQIGALTLLTGTAGMLPTPSARASPLRATPLSRSAGQRQDEPIPSPTVPDGGGLSSVSCTGTTTSMAVGSTVNSADVGVPAAQERTGTRWRLLAAGPA